jgi:hypothetical protein
VYDARGCVDDILPLPSALLARMTALPAAALKGASARA